MLTFQRSHRHRKKHHFKAPLFCVFFIHDYISMRVLRSCKNLLFMSHGKRDFVHPLCHPLFVSLHMSHDKPHVVHFRSHGKRDMAHQFTTRGGGRGETQSPFLSLFSQVTVNEISCVIFAKERKEKKNISSKEVTAKRTQSVLFTRPYTQVKSPCRESRQIPRPLCFALLQKGEKNLSSVVTKNSTPSILVASYALRRKKHS